MHQKYLLSIDTGKNVLHIKEYAVVEKNIKTDGVQSLNEDSYTFLCEETYPSGIILESITKGTNALITAIRTLTFFPTGHNAERIAREVEDLYKTPENGLVVELVLNDIESLGA